MVETRYEHYEESSWDSWEETILGHITRERHVDSGCFLPSPEEIDERKANMRWLREHEFSDEFNFFVMQCNHPGIALVKKLTAKHGAERAEEMLTTFLPRTKYHG